MSKKILQSKFLLSLLFLNLLSITVLGIEDASLDVKWEYSAPEEITTLQVYNWDNDSYPEIIFSADNKIYFLGKEGKLKENFTVYEDSKIHKRITSINLGKNSQLWVGLGWMENFPVKESYFNETELKEEVLYEQTLHQGEIKVFDKALKEFKEKSVEGWIRDMWVGDLDLDGEEEVVISTGGLNTFHYEKISSEEKLNMSSRIRKESSWTGSLKIFQQNFTLISDKSFSDVVWRCSALDLLRELDLEILAVSSDKKAYCLSRNSSLLWEYSSDGELRYLWTGDLEDDGVKEILVGSITPTLSTIQGLKRDGKKFLKFRIPIGERLRGITVENLDVEEGKEIIVLTDKNLYAFNTKGEEKFSIPLFGANYFEVRDLDLNGYPNILVASHNKISSYEISPEIFHRKEADFYYEQAQKFFLRNYTLSKEYAQKARKIYLKLNYTQGVTKTRELILKLDEKILNKKKNQAQSLYAESLTLMSVRDYSSAKEYAQKARKIYLEINSQEGIKKCNQLINEIEDLMQKKETTTSTLRSTLSTTTSTLPSSTTTLPPKPPQANLSLFIFLSLVIFGIILFLLKRKIGEKERKKEEEELKI